MNMFDSIANVNDYLSEHWLAEVFPSKLRDLAATWKELAAKGKETPVRGLATLNGAYLTQLASLPERTDQEFTELVTQTHQTLLRAVGFDATPTELATSQAETPINVPLLGRFSSPTSADALHVLQAVPVDSVDAMLGDEAHLLVPITLAVTGEKTEKLEPVSKAITQLFVSDDPPRYLLVVAGSAVLVTDAARWSEGRYLAFDVATALDRRDDKALGELAFHAGLWSADVLLPNDDGETTLDAFTEDSEKHAVGVSEDLREGLRISIEKIANEVLEQRRASGQPVEGIPELPRDLTTQSLRFLYRILFLLFAEARPELGILPVGAPEYGSGYGLDRLREIVQVPLTGSSAGGHHLHESLNLLFRLVNDGHNAETADGDGLVFEAMRSDLFDKKRTPLIDNASLSNQMLQEVLTLLLLSKPSKNKNSQRGYISYAQLGINQLGAVYEGLMSYSGLIADDDMVEVAKDGNADKGSWLVSSSRSGEYDEKDLVWREDRLTGRKDLVRHPSGSYVFRLSGRDRQRSASYYTPEVLTKCLVEHALAELITDDTKAQQILEYRICEPALGSGAFLNEAINQLAAEYLSRRQDEVGRRIDPDAYTGELQKVKAFIALHRVYGVDLNSTAVELAEVSLWLNVMHRGLQAPWFGLHLRRGNSLIGARRATYDFTSLGRAKKSWLKTPPTNRPLYEGAIGDGEIHHFLLPAGGWAAIVDAKQANELATERAAALRKWRSEVFKKPTAKQLDRLRALSRRVERLWGLAVRRLEISEREISRGIDIWGMGDRQTMSAVPRELVEEELFDPEGPFMRLRLAMDAWCAMWFLSIEGDEQPNPPSVDEWISTLEGLLGAAGVGKRNEGQAMFHESIQDFSELSKFDDLERQFAGMRAMWQLYAEHPWLGIVRNVAEQQGFLHWELDFAQIFERGGFDLQVGNPPWVRPDWWELTVLADADPYFALEEKIPDPVLKDRRNKVLADPEHRRRYLADLSIWAGTAANVKSSIEYPVLAKIRTNLYMNFMVLGWRNTSSSGVCGLIHQDSYLIDPNAGGLRAVAYRRLRRSWNFLNKKKLFSEIGDGKTFSLNVYGSEGPIDFLYATTLLDPSTLNGSFSPANESAELPGVQLINGEWDLRPHPSRILRVDQDVLDGWKSIFDPPDTPSGEGKIVRPLLKENLNVLSVFGRYPRRMAQQGYFWAKGWNEKYAKDDGTITYGTRSVSGLDELILQGSYFSVANPLSANPRLGCRGPYDYDTYDLNQVGRSEVPRTNYSYAVDKSTYEPKFRRWGSHPYTSNYRVAVRDMLDPSMERTLISAIIPPGPAHVHTVDSVAIKDESGQLTDNYKTALTAGLWSSLAMDYLVKVSGQSHIQPGLVDRLPLPLQSATTDLIVYRTLRLNCVTDAYADLWDQLYDPDVAAMPWSNAEYERVTTMSIGAHGWREDVPLRDEFSRRAALLEIDVLTAITFGLSITDLISAYRAQFWKLMRREADMAFDSRGSKIAEDSFAYGVSQLSGDFKLVAAFERGEECGDLLVRYTPFPADGGHGGRWFYHPNREAEMRTAYANFEQRLAIA